MLTLIDTNLNKIIIKGADYMSFGKRLKKIRESTNLTQAKISKELKVTSQAYSQYERNVRMPDSYMIDRLADYYNVSTDYLLGRCEDPSPIKPTPIKIKLAEEIYIILLEKNILSKDEELTSEHIEWLKKLIVLAIELKQF